MSVPAVTETSELPQFVCLVEAPRSKYLAGRLEPEEQRRHNL